MIAQFTTEDFTRMGVCHEGLVRVKQFGGVIENSAEGWAAYIAAYPEAWQAPVFTAGRLDIAGDLAWRIARIAFREQPERNAHLRIYAETLGPDNWQEARSAANAAAHAAHAAAHAAHAAYDAANAAAYAANAAADAANAAYDAYDAANAAAYAYDAANAAAHAAHAAHAAYAAADARRRVWAEIAGLAIEVLTK
jgi:hypothetical protein